MDRLIPILRRAGIAAVILAAGTGMAQKDQGNGMTTNIPGSLPNIHLVSPVANWQWTMPAGDYGNLRYSPLSQINANNVHGLHVVANMSDGIPHGHEGGPLVVGSTITADPSHRSAGAPCSHWIRGCAPNKGGEHGVVVVWLAAV